MSILVKRTTRHSQLGKHPRERSQSPNSVNRLPTDSIQKESTKKKQKPSDVPFQTQDEFDTYVKKLYKFIKGYSLASEDIKTIHDHLHVGAYQDNHKRATFDCCHLKINEKLQSVVTKVNNEVKEVKELTNYFWNINIGDPNHRVFHTDGNDIHHSGRILMQFVPNQNGFLLLRSQCQKFEHSIEIPYGQALVCDRTLLQSPYIQHAHGANGANISMVYNLKQNFSDIIAIDEINHKVTNNLVFGDFPEWNKEDCKGRTFGRTPWNIEKAVLSHLWGPKFNRLMTNTEAKEIMRRMSEDERNVAKHNYYSALSERGEVICPCSCP